MAMFEGMRPHSTKGRIGGNISRLIVSGGMSPHEEWELDPKLPVRFTNPYGSPGQQSVAVGKGMIVSVAADPVWSFERSMYHPALTIADYSKSLVPCGMAPYNFCKGRDDRFEGNRPAIITRDYVELPWFNRPEDAAEIPYGAFHGQDIKLNPGFVKLSRSNPGQCELWNPEFDKEYEIVGQILGFNKEAEPWGFFKWVMWDETEKFKMDAYMNPSGKVPASGDPDKGGNFGWPFDPEYKTVNNSRYTMNGYLSQFTTKPTGIPGLYDGANRSVQKKEFTIAAGTPETTPQVWKLDFPVVLDPATETLAPNCKVQINGVDVSSANYSIDADAKTVRYAVPADAVEDQKVVITYFADMIGTPPGWDYKGAVGVVRMLLKF